MTDRITTVLFDLGDTLVDAPSSAQEEALCQAQQRVAALLTAWGFATGSFSARRAYEAAQAAELRAYRTDCVLPALNSVIRQAAVAEGLSLTEEQAGRLWQACRIDQRALGRRPASAAMETLAWLKERGYRLGCVTNTLFGGNLFHDELQADGLAPYFGVVAVSCDLGFMKPHPRIFRYALAALAAQPAETLMVGDSLRADIGGAKSLGLTAVWKRRTDAFPATERALMRAGLGPQFEPDCVIDNLWQLTQLPVLRHD